ncbi:triose-phosphate transporter family-domain-containing protein [Schizophyllum commune]
MPANQGYARPTDSLDGADSRAHEDTLDLDAELGEVHLATPEERKRLWWRHAATNSLFIASWFFFAIILSVYNKWMFSDDHFHFPYPLLVTTFHMLVQFLLAAVLRYAWPQHFRPANSPSRTDYGTKAVPTAMATGLDIGLSNLSLKTISLSFYTMCKSSSLIFVLLFAFIFRLEVFSLRLIGVIFLIFAGVLLMVATETHFVFGGFLLVLSASALGGLRWSLTQLLLKKKDMGMDNPAATLFWLAPAMAVTLGVISLIMDSWSSLLQSEFFESFGASMKTIFFLTAPGVLAFFMVLSEFYILQRAGVVPMSIAGIAKEVTTITISAWFFGDELTPLNITGVAITVSGIVLYTYHKYRKSIESPVPLDPHGNPLSTDDEALGATYDETVRLTSSVGEGDEPRTSSQVLFSAGLDDDDVQRRKASQEGGSQERWETKHGVDALLMDDARRESMDAARAWNSRP